MNATMSLKDISGERDKGKMMKNLKEQDKICFLESLVWQENRVAEHKTKNSQAIMT